MAHPGFPQRLTEQLPLCLNRRGSLSDQRLCISFSFAPGSQALLRTPSLKSSVYESNSKLAQGLASRGLPHMLRLG